MEELRLSRAEHESSPTAITTRRLTLTACLQAALRLSLGRTAEGDVVAELSNAQVFARRVGITYEEIVEILKTRFVNPSSTLIPKLERLGVPFATLKALKDGHDHRATSSTTLLPARPPSTADSHP